MLQSLALTGTCFIQIGIGVEMICSTIIIGALSTKNRTKGEWLTLTPEQESWFGTYVYKKKKVVLFVYTSSVYLCMYCKA